MIDVAVERLVQSEDELRHGGRALSRGSVLDEVKRLRSPREEQIPKRSSPDRARDLPDAKKGNQNDKKDRAQRQESGQRAAAEVGDACCERPALEPGFDRFLEDMKSHQHDREQEGVPQYDEHPRILPKSRLEIERLGDQDHFAEHEGVDDGEGLLPDADPVLLEDHSPIEAEQGEEHPKIERDDGVLAQFVESTGFEARLLRSAGAGRRRRSRHILHRKFP